MQKEIAVAIIGGIFGIVTALIGKIPVDAISSSRMRSQSKIPSSLIGSKWRAQWYKPDGKLFIEDVVTFKKWAKDNHFEGYGEVIWDNKQFKYSIAGEVAPNKTVVLTYKAESFPVESNIGVACLKLSEGQRALDGYWIAHSDDVHDLAAAKVTMARIS